MYNYGIQGKNENCPMLEMEENSPEYFVFVFLVVILGLFVHCMVACLHIIIQESCGA